MAITKTYSQVHIFSKVVLSAKACVETNLRVHIRLSNRADIHTKRSTKTEFFH